MSVTIKVIEDYSIILFIQIFIRLLCEGGYPNVLLTEKDILKECETIRLNVLNIESKLFRDMRVEFEVWHVAGTQYAWLSRKGDSKNNII